MLTASLFLLQLKQLALLFKGVLPLSSVAATGNGTTGEDNITLKGHQLEAVLNPCSQ